MPVAESVRRERIKVGDETETSISGLVNHMPRQLGSQIGKVCGLSEQEVKEVGLWGSDVHSSHYFNTYESHLVAKLSGYPSKESFWMPRAMATIDQFCSASPEHQALFHGFMPFLDSEEVWEEAQRKRAKNEQQRTPVMVLKALKTLREVFFQDLLYYKQSWPDLRMWKCALFAQNHQALEKWLDFVQSFEMMEGPAAPCHGAVGVDTCEIRLLREEVRANSTKIDTLRTEIGRSAAACEKEPDPPTGSTEGISVHRLRALNGL